MAASLRGELRDFGIADVFQLIGQQRKTGVLVFSGDSQQMKILFDAGAVVSATPVGSWAEAAFAEMLMRCGLLSREQVEESHRECGASARTLSGFAASRGWVSETDLGKIEDLLTRETIFSVLRWKAGSFDFTAMDVEHDRSADSLLGAEQILMDGLRMVDEWQSFAELVPSEDTIFRRLLSFDHYSDRCGEESPAQLANVERIFELVDGRLPVRRIIDLSMLGTFDSVRALALLHRLNIIETVEPEVLEPSAAVAPGAARRPPSIGGLTAIGSLAFLALVTVAAQLWSRAGDAPDAFSIQRPAALERARIVHETHRVRHALETYWFAHGSWPSSLAELADDGLLSHRQLASEDGRPYYFAIRGDGAWLLAPDH